jgi:hypothetical protein
VANAPKERKVEQVRPGSLGRRANRPVAALFDRADHSILRALLTSNDVRGEDAKCSLKPRIAGVLRHVLLRAYAEEANTRS